MNWKFWQKSAMQWPNRTSGTQAGPTTIPEPVARYMVVELEEEAEWVWYLKAVERSCPGIRYDYDVRVFQTQKVLAENVQVRNYGSLDKYPELIVLQGTYNKKTGEVRPDPSWEARLKAA